MRLIVISIGRLKQGPERELAERYRERFDDIGRKLGFRGLEIHEIPESRARDAATRIAEEAAAISAAIPEKSAAGGARRARRQFDSAAFARHLGRWRDESVANTIFIIGGADGLSPDLRRKAKLQPGVRLRDLAAPDGSRHASGTDLPGRDHFGGPSLSPRLNHDPASRKAPFATNAASAEHRSRPRAPRQANASWSAFRLRSRCCPLASPASPWPASAQVATPTPRPRPRRRPTRSSSASRSSKPPAPSRKTPRNCRRNSRPTSRRSVRTAASSISN